MNHYFGQSGAPVRGAQQMQQARTPRSAALLIDFDNVTLGVHSDLGRELKSLINSEVFRGKIAVRRAYADWRRYPSYVVPLTEASIDLIFAPAYGSSKKNTTDLRMSADAIELAFTRPEIDTFILLTGDSDFSSTVMKLKEYGKYVIGVGMRESSSDLIIQNCDEYFSYHTLTGLTRTSLGEGMREDPWELAIRAAQKMASSGDAMRTDRLKQVMLSIDPAFNEKELGYSKFSRFVTELEKKGLLRLHKLPDGQYEIVVNGRGTPAGAAPEGAAPPVPRDARGPRDGRRDRRFRRKDEGEVESAAAASIEAETPKSEVPAAPEKTAVETGPRREAEGPRAAEPRHEEVPAATTGEAPAVAPDSEPPAVPMQAALALLQRAVRELAPKRSDTARDGDVKRRMVEMEPSFDESKLGFSKFSRFLRAAHDAEAVDLQRIDGGRYEVTIGSRAFVAPAPGAEERASAEPARPARGRGERRPTEKPAEVAEPGATPEEVASAPAERSAPEEAASPTTAPVEPARPEAPAAAPVLPLRGRRRGTGALPAGGAPPILPGQVVKTAAARTAVDTISPAAAVERAEPQPTVTETVAAEAAAPTEAAPPEPRRRTRRGRRGATVEATPELLPGQVVEPSVTVEIPVETGTAAEQMEAEQPARKRRSRGRGKKAQSDQPAQPRAEPLFSAEDLGLPTDPAEIEQYVTRNYRGVGKATARPLLDAFGSDVFRVLAEEPVRVRELLGDRRAGTVLDQWAEDLSKRSPAPEEAAPDEMAEAAVPAEASATEADAGIAEPQAEGNGPARRRRRGGRGRKANLEAGAATPQAVVAPESAATTSAPDESKPKPSPRRSGRGGRGRSGAKKGQPSEA
jgi:uncharacterized protein (TIGR00288 family)